MSILSKYRRISSLLGGGQRFLKQDTNSTKLEGKTLLFKLHSGTSLVSPVVKNYPSEARDVDLVLSQATKIPHTEGQLSLQAATREATQRGPSTAKNN